MDPGQYVPSSPHLVPSSASQSLKLTMISLPLSLCICCSLCLLCLSFCLCLWNMCSGPARNPSLCSSCSPLSWEELVAPSGASNRGLAMPQVCQSSGQESTSPPVKGPIEGKDMPGALWTQSPEAGGAVRSPGGPVGCPGRPGSEVTVSPVTPAPAHSQAVQPRVGECSCLPCDLGVDSRDQLGVVSPAPYPCCPKQPCAELCPVRWEEHPHPTPAFQPGHSTALLLLSSCCPQPVGQWRRSSRRSRLEGRKSCSSAPGRRKHPLPVL